MGCCEDYLTCDIAFNAVMPLSRASTRRRYSRIEGVTARLPPWARPYPRGLPIRRLLLFFGRKKANLQKKIWAKVSIQSELRISIYIYETVKGQKRRTQKQKRDRETYPNLEGLSPLPCHGDQGPEGKPFSHLGRRSRKKKKEGLSPPRFRWRRNATGGHHHHRDLHEHLRHLHQHLHHLPPSIYSGPLSRNPLYPLLEHGALCFILLSNDVLPSYDV